MGKQFTMSDVAKAEMEYEFKKARAQAIKTLTNNGKNRKLVRDIERLLADDETRGMMNALFAATQKGKR